MQNLTCSLLTLFEGLRRDSLLKASAAICFLSSWVATTFCVRSQYFHTIASRSLKSEQHGITYLFEWSFDSVPNCLDFFPLTQTMNPTECLLFHHGIPLRFEEVCDRSRSEIKSTRKQLAYEKENRIIAKAEIEEKRSTNPAPPQVMETRMTWMFSSVWNFWIASSLLSPECWPSIRVYEMKACWSKDSIKSSVNVQYEKTTL